MPQHSDDIIAQRRATVAKLYLQGWRQVDIARRECVTQQQVSQDLEAIRKDWAESTLVNFNEAKIKELATIDHLEQTMWDAWEKSMSPLKKKSTKMRGSLDEKEKDPTKKKDVKTKNLETTESTEERLPDPRYALVIDRCIEKRIRILGLEAPMKFTETDPEGKAVQRRTWIILDHTGGRRVREPDEL